MSNPESRVKDTHQDQDTMSGKVEDTGDGQTPTRVTQEDTGKCKATKTRYTSMNQVKATEIATRETQMKAKLLCGEQTKTQTMTKLLRTPDEGQATK